MNASTPTFDLATLSFAPNAQKVMDFWMAAGPEQWFRKDDVFDARFRVQFFEAHLAAARQEYGHWLEQPLSALALLILLDQYPRNSFRGTAHMFATDALARQYAAQAISVGLDRLVPDVLRPFFYLPLMHSEDLADQERCVVLCQGLAAGNTLAFAIEHRDIIARFGRFPHRNTQLLRETTAQERAFLDAGGFAG
ncbi:DUF924 family protein [Lampropedia puyangensis]|uniref:DUF924 family protein n=1 Tax=Lampropedia puyangensis TaxID=1330072 RepID=A0A4V6T2Q5_9BURK|nr:DUF924 family protein [Lampropedia puyangensis]THU01476.1 DUF924 family protein [Lampropedia puyangensis]